MKMNIRALMVYGLVSLAFVLCSRAAAECDLKLEVDNAEWRGGAHAGYGVFDPGEYPQTIQFKVRLVSGDACPFFVSFGGVAQGNFQRQASSGNESINYQIYDSLDRRMLLKDLPSATANEVLPGAFGPGEVIKDLSYVIVVPPEQIKPSGRYTSVIRITLYSGTPDNFIQQDSKTVTFSIMVEEATELSLISSGSAFDPNGKSQAMDFGPLAKGKAKGFDLRIRSNVGYHVILESENGGVLNNIDPQYKNAIPYVLETGGKPVNLNSGRQTAISRNNGLTDGDRHELRVTIGDTSKVTAGTYRDHILVTVISDN
ncbi:MAG TPA: hypothetical protein VN873_13565 [Candidatus Angelobacter sp.]|nr:hypothetical protein [Candidatus Angelobacter sp.]